MEKNKIKDILKKYVEYGEKDYFEAITVEKVYRQLGIDKKVAEEIADRYEYKQIKEIREKFTKSREFGFYEKNDKKKYDEEKTRATVLKWAKAQPNLKSLDETTIWNKYKNKEFGFGSFTKFYEWYDAQEPKCHYCGTTESNLKKLFKEKDNESEKEKKPLYSKKRSFTATLQVDRKNSDEGYNEKNCVLACAFCNNAKSDMVRECDLDCFEKPFGEFVKNFYADLDKKYKLGLND